jgi:hypothetical protein
MLGNKKSPKEISAELNETLEHADIDDSFSDWLQTLTSPPAPPPQTAPVQQRQPPADDTPSSSQPHALPARPVRGPGGVWGNALATIPQNRKREGSNANDEPPQRRARYDGPRVPLNAPTGPRGLGVAAPNGLRNGHSEDGRRRGGGPFQGANGGPGRSIFERAGVRPVVNPAFMGQPGPLGRGGHVNGFVEDPVRMMDHLFPHG